MPTIEQHKLSVKKTIPIMGMTVTDSISGITGVVRGVRVLNSGCEHILVQRKGIGPDGDPMTAIWLDLVTLVDSYSLPVTDRPDLLGKKVKDTLTGYTGTVTSVVFMDTSDTRIYIQGTTRTDEGLPSPEFICDLATIERLDKKPVKKTKAPAAPAFLTRARRHYV